jgi:hypothetical protein
MFYLVIGDYGFELRCQTLEEAEASAKRYIDSSYNATTVEVFEVNSVKTFTSCS